MGALDRKIPNSPLGVHGVVDEVTFHSRLVTTTNGTLAATSGVANPTWTPAGQTATKTAAKTGRYTMQLPVNYNRLLQITATLIGPDDVAYTLAKGIDFFVRDVDIGNAPPNSLGDGTVEIQFVRGDTVADAELVDGSEVMVTIVVAQGKVF